MKPIKRLDARPDDLEIIAKERYAAILEAERLARIEYDRTHTPEYLKQTAEAEIYRAKKHKEDLEQMWREWDMETKTRMIDDPAGQFVYYDRVRVSNPLPDGNCNKGQIAFLNREGFIESQNSCQCLHSVSRNCYYVLLDGNKSATHFEECELEKERL